MESETLYSKPGHELNLVFLQPNDDNENSSDQPAVVGDDNLKAAKNGRLSAKASSTAVDLLAEEEVFAPPPPPDGGYGWFVVLGAFFVNLLCDGTCFSFAIFFNDLGDHFDEPESTVAWVGSCVVGCYLLIGPCAGALADRYGCRAVCIAGAIVTATAFILSVFSPNIYVLIILYGVIGGIGMGLSYLPSVVIVGLYFEKRRATATGISVCGSGVGCFVIAPLMTTLLHSYGWQGAFLISAGIMLNCAVCGAIFRPLKSHQNQNKAKLKETKVFELEPAAGFLADPKTKVANIRSGGAARRHLDSTNLSDVSSIYDSNKSVVFAASRLTIMEPMDEQLGETDALRQRNSRAAAAAIVSPGGRRHRVVSLCDDGVGGGGGGSGLTNGVSRVASSTRVLRLVDDDDDDRDAQDVEVVILTGSSSLASSATSRPRSPSEGGGGFMKRNLERIPEVKSQKTIRSKEGVDEEEKRSGKLKNNKEVGAVAGDKDVGGGILLVREEAVNDAKAASVHQGRPLNSNSESAANGPTKTAANGRTTAAANGLTATAANGLTTTATGLTTTATVLTTTATTSRGNIGFKPLDELDMRALQLTGGPKRLGASTREAATVATGLTNYYLVENQEQRNESQTSKYWQRKKDLISPEGSQLTLHAIPTNLSMKWVDSVGTMPHPETVLKYRTPTKLHRTTSSVSRGRTDLPPLAKKDIFYSRSIMSVDHYQSMRSGIAQVDDDDDDDDDDDEIDDQVKEEQLVVRKKSSCKKCWSNFQGLIDCSLMKSPTFVLYSISGMLVMIAITVVYMFLMKYGESHGLQQDKTKWFISIIGITNSVCRILVGLIADAPWADVVHITTFTMAIGALGSILLPFVANSFALIAVYCCIFALSIACYVSLRSIVMVKLFGLEKLTNSFGISLLFQGIACLLGPPIAGKLFEATGSYTLSFVCTGLCFLIAALLHGPIRQIAKWEAKYKEIHAAAAAASSSPKEL